MEDIDQTSRLPQPVLQHILCFLVVKDAARTSILSKAWNSSWNSLGCLNFGDEEFGQPKEVVDHILENLQGQNISIHKLVLNIPYHRDNFKYVGKWIDILVASNIKELYLETVKPPHCYHKLHRAIFAAKSLNVLSLGGFMLEMPSHPVKLSSLRELYLSDSYLDDRLLQVLCASCCDLQVLDFYTCDGLINLQVAGTLPKLKRVNLTFCPGFQNIDIISPNLSYLQFISTGLGLNAVKITACKTLKYLILSKVAVTDEWLENIFSNLPNLESFFVSASAALKTIKISSERLKYVGASRCDKLIVVDLDTPNLLRFSCDVSCNGPAIKLEVSPLLDVYLSLFPKTLDTLWYSKLIECLANFNHSKSIHLDCKNEEVIVVPKDMRENLFPPLYGTSCLDLNIMSGLIHSVVDVLDSLLCISPQMNTLTFRRIQGSSLRLDFYFIYRDAKDGDERPCCAPLPWKCWRHSLEKVKLRNFTCTELQELSNYFLTNADVSEIIQVPPECSLP